MKFIEMAIMTIQFTRMPSLTGAGSIRKLPSINQGHFRSIVMTAMTTCWLRDQLQFSSGSRSVLHYLTKGGFKLPFFIVMQLFVYKSTRAKICCEKPGGTQFN